MRHGLKLMVTIDLENRFNAPPAYVQAWLTDFKPDDGMRWFDHPAPGKVQRSGNTVTLDGTMQMGDTHTVVTIESPTRWTAQTTMSKKGKTTMRSKITETVEPTGAGTLHRVHLEMTALAFPMKLMSPFMKPMVARQLKAGFTRMATEMETSHKAGKPPTS